MKRKNAPRKLKLNRQTVRSLNADDLGQVAGGATSWCQSASHVCVCPTEDDCPVAVGFRPRRVLPF